MPKCKRLEVPNDVEYTPKTMIGFRADADTRAMLEAIAAYEERVPSDTLRMLIKRAYRALPPEAQLVHRRAHHDTTEAEQT